MLTFGQRFKRKQEAKAALRAGEPLAPSPESLHIQRHELQADVEYVAALPTRADRTEHKRDVLLPKWLPLVERYLDAEKVHQNPIFAWCIIWLFDVGDFDKALDYADIAIEQGQQTPDRLKREFSAFVADTIMEWSETQNALGHSVEPYFSRTFQNMREKWRLHEEINAKWFKFAGLLLLNDHNGKPLPSAIEDVEILQNADDLLAQAEKFNPLVGVKTMRNKIAMRINKLTSES